MFIPLSLRLSNVGKLSLFIFFILSSNQIVFANANNLKEKYEEIEDDILENIYAIPIHIESNEKRNIIRGGIYSIIYHPFNIVSKNLNSISNWCEIMPLHLNIKACTYQYINKQCNLTFYSGRKFYEKADDVYRLNYQFNVTALEDDYLKISLTSNEGPIGTTDYIITVEAIPITDSSTFFYLSYEYKSGFWSRLAMSSYFSTLGYGKVGFTIIDKDDDGKPIYIKGIRGVIERNSMRYYFAIKSFLNTQVKQEPFEERINSWFDFTEEYHKQLYELSKKDYLKYKHKERKDQIRLQNAIFKYDSEEIVPLNTTCRMDEETKKDIE